LVPLYDSTPNRALPTAPELRSSAGCLRRPGRRAPTTKARAYASKHYVFTNSSTTSPPQHARRAFRNSVLAAGWIALFMLPLALHAQPQQTSFSELVRATAQNQLADNPHHQLFAWKTRTYHGRNTQVEHVVQTPDGEVSRVVLINDKPLNPVQQSQEQERVRKMLSPSEMRRRLKAEQEDEANTRKMLAAMADAFNFTYVESSTAPNGHKLVTLNFAPRPGFTPPNRETAVFTGMQGKVVIDESAKRIVKIDGTLFKDVNFGWGILGRLYKGGRFVVEEAEITPTHWDTTRMYLHFDGKVLMFKPLHIDENESYWDYQPVPPMSAQQALQFLKRAEPPQNARSSTSSGSSSYAR
jgi:hypothetical protein